MLLSLYRTTAHHFSRDISYLRSPLSILPSLKKRTNPQYRRDMSYFRSLLSIFHPLHYQIPSSYFSSRTPFRVTDSPFSLLAHSAAISSKSLVRASISAVILAHSCASLLAPCLSKNSTVFFWPASAACHYWRRNTQNYFLITWTLYLNNMIWNMLSQSTNQW